MPFIPREPVEVIPRLTADSFEVTGININTSDAKIEIVWRGKDASGRPVRQGTLQVDGSQLATENPDASLSYYENLKAVAYELLHEAGIMPRDGTVE